MKSKLLTALFLSACFFGKGQAATELFWDPQGDGSGAGSTQWNIGTPWRDGSGAVLGPPVSGLGAATAWTNSTSGSPVDAYFFSNDDGGVTPVTSLNVTLGSGNVTTRNLTVLSGPNGNQATLTVLPTVSSASLTVTGTVDLSKGGLELQQGNVGAVTTVYHFTGSGTTGTGSLTLNKTDNTANSNLFIDLGGANTTIGPANTDLDLSSSKTGFVGVYSTSTTAVVDRNITASGLAGKIYLGATNGNTLTFKGNLTVDNNQVVQIGSQAAIGPTGSTSVQKGVVALGDGTAGVVNISTKIELNAGTLLINSSTTVNKNSLGGGNYSLDLGTSTPSGTLGSVTVTGTSTVKLADTIGDVYEKAGALTLQANSVLDFGNNASNKSSVIEFGSANFSTWGTNTLSVWNYTPGVDHLIFDSVTGTIMMSTPYGVIPTTADILFYSDNGQTLINRFGGFPLANSYQYENPNYYTYAGEVVPVPEPTAILSMGLLLVAVGWKERRFICRFFGRAPEMAPSPA